MLEKNVRKDMCLILNGCETRLFDSLDLSQIFCVGLDDELSLQKKRRTQETNCWHAFRMLLPERKVGINSDEKHASFAHELPGSLRLTVGFF